jgi:hypothetical protein
MRLQCVFLTIIVILAAATASASPTVTLTLESSRNGQTVSAGMAVDWTIKVSVSTGDNVGLALLSCDLAQNAANPAKFNIPPGDPASIPAGMANFNRPAGITNPGEGGAASGYIGVQRGTAGEMKLVQIGGAQNTFGTAMAAGSGIGENATVVGGIGQSGSAQLVLSGSSNAPAAAGTYTFHLENVAANVLTALNSPPAFSPVASAIVNLTGASFSVTVGGLRGDLNCDGSVNFQDINPFVLYLSNPSSWQATFPGCLLQNGDINADGTYPSFGDINPFVTLLSGGG